MSEIPAGMRLYTDSERCEHTSMVYEALSKQVVFSVF